MSMKGLRIVYVAIGRETNRRHFIDII